MAHELYPSPALLPTMKWIDSIPPSAPKVKLSIKNDGQKLLQWMVDNPTDEALQFAIYRFKPEEPKILSPNNLVEIVRGNSYLDKKSIGGKFTYIVTALDRMHNESKLSNLVD
jgi:hypothetical protein